MKYRDWAIGIYPYTTNIKGTSSMHLHRELGVSQEGHGFCCTAFVRLVRRAGFCLLDQLGNQVVTLPPLKQFGKTTKTTPYPYPAGLPKATSQGKGRSTGVH